MRETVFHTRGGDKLRCIIWDNVKKPIGVVQVIHGPNRYAHQYDAFAKFLNKNGYIVFSNADDSIPDASDIFMARVNIEIEILKHLNEKYKIPVFLFGHNYGSFITQRVMERTNLCAAGVCMSGGVQYPIWLLRFGAMIAWFGIKIYGADTRAKLLGRMFPVGISQKKLHRFSFGFYYSLIHNLIQISYNVDSDMPILIINGGTSIFRNTPRLANALYKAYQAHNMKNLTVIIYPNIHHELLMELNHHNIQRDVLEFFNSIQRPQNVV